jgi:hypothetical protein
VVGCSKFKPVRKKSLNTCKIYFVPKTRIYKAVLKSIASLIFSQLLEYRFEKTLGPRAILRDGPIFEFEGLNSRLSSNSHVETISYKISINSR